MPNNSYFCTFSKTIFRKLWWEKISETKNGDWLYEKHAQWAHGQSGRYGLGGAEFDQIQRARNMPNVPTKMLSTWDSIINCKYHSITVFCASVLIIARLIPFVPLDIRYSVAHKFGFIILVLDLSIFAMLEFLKDHCWNLILAWWFGRVSTLSQFGLPLRLRACPCKGPAPLFWVRRK